MNFNFRRWIREGWRRLVEAIKRPVFHRQIALIGTSQKCIERVVGCLQSLAGIHPRKTAGEDGVREYEAVGPRRARPWLIRVPANAAAEGAWRHESDTILICLDSSDRADEPRETFPVNFAIADARQEGRLRRVGIVFGLLSHADGPRHRCQASLAVPRRAIDRGHIDRFLEAHRDVPGEALADSRWRQRIRQLMTQMRIRAVYEVVSSTMRKRSYPTFFVSDAVGVPLASDAIRHWVSRGKLPVERSALRYVVALSATTLTALAAGLLTLSHGITSAVTTTFPVSGDAEPAALKGQLIQLRDEIREFERESQSFDVALARRFTLATTEAGVGDIPDVVAGLDSAVRQIEKLIGFDHLMNNVNDLFSTVVESSDGTVRNFNDRYQHLIDEQRTLRLIGGLEQERVDLLGLGMGDVLIAAVIGGRTSNSWNTVAGRDEYLPGINAFNQSMDVAWVAERDALAHGLEDLAQARNLAAFLSGCDEVLRVRSTILVRTGGLDKHALDVHVTELLSAFEMDVTELETQIRCKPLVELWSEGSARLETLHDSLGEIRREAGECSARYLSLNEPAREAISGLRAEIAAALGPKPSTLYFKMSKTEVYWHAHCPGGEQLRPDSEGKVWCPGHWEYGRQLSIGINSQSLIHVEGSCSLERASVHVGQARDGRFNRGSAFRVWWDHPASEEWAANCPNPGGN